MKQTGRFDDGFNVYGELQGLPAGVTIYFLQYASRGSRSG
jgi:hypothetical protein